MYSSLNIVVEVGSLEKAFEDISVFNRLLDVVVTLVIMTVLPLSGGLDWAEIDILIPKLEKFDIC